MATFLRANNGHRVKAVVRRRGHRPVTRTFDTRKEAEFWAADVEKKMEGGIHADLGPAVRLPLRRVIDLYSRRYTGRKRGWRQETNRVKAWLKDPHEGISRLFEVGLTLPEVMQMSGHTTPTMLMRYTHLHVDPIAAKRELSASPGQRISRCASARARFQTAAGEESLSSAGRGVSWRP